MDTGVSADAAACGVEGVDEVGGVDDAPLVAADSNAASADSPPQATRMNAIAIPARRVQ